MGKVSTPVFAAFATSRETLLQFFGKMEKSGLKGTEYHFGVTTDCYKAGMKSELKAWLNNRKKVEECLPG